MTDISLRTLYKIHAECQRQYNKSGCAFCKHNKTKPSKELPKRYGFPDYIRYDCDYKNIYFIPPVVWNLPILLPEE